VLRPVDDGFAATREILRVVATHVLARGRSQATGRFGLRVTPGGFGTPQFGSESKRLRISGRWLISELTGPAGASSRAIALDGSSLRALAECVDVQLDPEFSVGLDTPPLGDVDAPMAVHEPSLRVLADWYALAASALDEVLAEASSTAAPAVVQLWPEHFDVAVDLEAAPGRRTNLGGSPGDEFSPEPYLYVGPWSPDRPGDATFWNAPFGGVLRYGDLRGVDDPWAAAVAFFRRGTELLSS